MTAGEVILLVSAIVLVLAIGGWWADGYDRRDAARRNRRPR